MTALYVPARVTVDLGCRTRKTRLALAAHAALAADWGRTRAPDKAKRLAPALVRGRTPREIVAAYAAAHPALNAAPEVRFTFTYPAPRKRRAPKGWARVGTATPQGATV